MRIDASRLAARIGADRSRRGLSAGPLACLLCIALVGAAHGGSWFGGDGGGPRVGPSRPPAQPPRGASLPPTSAATGAKVDRLVLEAQSEPGRCRTVLLDLEKDKVSERTGRRYSRYNARSAVILDDYVVIGDRDGDAAILYDRAAIRKAGARRVLPCKVVPLPGSRNLKRVRLGAQDAVINGNLEVYRLAEDLAFRRTPVQPPAGIRWSGIDIVDGGPLVVAVEGRDLYLVDLSGKTKSRRRTLEQRARRVAVVGEHMFLEERWNRDADLRFSVWHLGRRGDGTFDAPRFLARSEAVSGWCYHLMRCGPWMVAGVETTGAGRHRSLLQAYAFRDGELRCLHEQDRVSVRGLLAADGYVLGNGWIFRLDGRGFSRLRRFDRVRQMDGFPFFADLRGSHLAMPGNPDGSCYVFLKEPAFEAWR